MDYTNQKRKYIIFGVILVITLLIIGIAYYLISLNNAKGQIFGIRGFKYSLGMFL